MNTRTTLATDEGAANSCAQACSEFGKFYGPTYHGVPLHQKLANGSVVTSALGDLASLAVIDHDFYLQKDVVAGMWSRGNSFTESGVAQSDFCCCEVK